MLICWLQLLKCDDNYYLFLSFMTANESLGFGLLAGQFEDITFSSGELHFSKNVDS